MTPDEALQLAIGCARELEASEKAGGRYEAASTNRELAEGLEAAQDELASLREQAHNTT